ncbi:strawberry notch C-terminal domain-containing protein [Reinekea sp. G2M2-21]|uniref:strawberry notch C-terminal domain-containing protein n=1 Tax=Reinekea sp. G2M2-21 TaxID=2788942 RepID=UPI0018AA8652|nr:strawberry notch C-terminal domain-containing protein [Reinekea sp. G2M2-21]
MNNAEYIVSSLPRSEDLLHRYKIDFQGRVQGNGSAQLFFRVPNASYELIQPLLQAKGIEVRTAIRNGQPVPGVFNISDNEGWQFQGFIETLAEVYPDAYFDFPALNDQSEHTLWIDGRLNGRSLDLIQTGNTAALVLGLHNPEEAFTPEARQHLTERYNFIPVKDSPGFVTTQGVQLKSDGSVQVQLGRYLKLMGEDTTLTPMNKAQIAGQAFIDAPAQASGRLAQSINAHTEVLGRALSVAHGHDIPPLNSLKSTLKGPNRNSFSEEADAPHAKFGSERLAGNHSRLRSLSQIKAEYRDAVAQTLGLSISEEDWAAKGQELSDAISNLVGLENTQDWNGAISAVKSLTEYMVNPGYDVPQWEDFLFDNEGQPRADTYSATVLSHLMLSRWDATLNTMGVALAKASSLDSTRDAAERARIESYFSDPNDVVDKSIFEPNSALLLMLSKAREEQIAQQKAANTEEALVALAMNHLQNKAPGRKDTFSLTSAHIAVQAKLSETLSNEVELLDLANLTFDDVMPDDYESAFTMDQALSHADSLEMPMDDIAANFHNTEPSEPIAGYEEVEELTVVDKLDALADTVAAENEPLVLNLDAIEDTREDDLADLISVEEEAPAAIQTETTDTEPEMSAFVKSTFQLLARQKSAEVLDDVKKRNNPNQVPVSEFDFFGNAVESTSSNDEVVEEVVSDGEESVAPTYQAQHEVTQADLAADPGVTGEPNEEERQTGSTVGKVVESRPTEPFEDSVLSGRVVPTIEDVEAIQLYRQVLEKARGMTVLDQAAPLLRRGDHYFACLLPKETHEDEATIETMEMNFELALSDISQQSFSALSQNSYQSIFSGKLRSLTALMGYLEPQTDYSHISALEGDVAKYIARTHFQPSEIEFLVEKLPLQAGELHVALADALIAAEDYSSFVELASRHVNKQSTKIPHMLKLIDKIPDDHASAPFAEKLGEMLESIQSPPSERVSVSDAFLATLVAKAEIAGIELSQYHLNTNYQKRGDVLPLLIESDSPNNGDFQVSVMNPFIGLGRDGIFTPEVVFDFEKGELVSAVAVVGDNGETVRIERPQLTVLWDRIANDYESLSEVSVSPGAVPQISAVADLDVDHIDDFDPDSVLSLDDVEEDDQLFEQSFDDIEPEELDEEVTEDPVPAITEKTVIGRNLKGKQVGYLVQSMGDGTSTGFRVVDGKSYSNPADALLMPSDMEFGSEEHKAFMMFQFANMLSHPDVFTDSFEGYSHDEIVNMAAAMSVSEDEEFPSPGAVRHLFDGDEGAINVAMVEECLEAAEAKVARQIVTGELVVKSTQTFDAVLYLRNAMPNRRVRTGEQRDMQQFSTPISAAFSLGELIQNHAELHGIVHGEYFEPTAGTGSLAINLPEQSKVVLNELSESRRALLNYAMKTNAKDTNVEILGHDAAHRDFRVLSAGFDGVIANPPFGTMEEAVEIDGWKTKRIDHAIVLRSLQALKETGAGTFIIGADSYIESERGKLNGASRAFFNHLQDNYNVLGIAHVELDAYKQRNAAFPLTVFTVQGRFPTVERIDVSQPLPQLLSDGKLDAWVEQIKTQQLSPEEMLEAKIEAVAALDERNKKKDKLSRTTSQMTRGSRDRDLERRKAASAGVLSETDSVEPALPDLPEPEAPSPLKKSFTEDSDVEAAKDATESSDDNLVSLDDRKSISKEKAQSGEDKPVQQYVPRSTLGRTDVGSVVVSETMRPGIEKALDFVEARYGSISNLLVHSLGLSSERINKTFADYQCDAIALALTSMDLGSEFVNGMGTGTGKGIVQAAALQMFRTLNQRFESGEMDISTLGGGARRSPVVFMCEKSDMFQDFFERDIGMVGEDLREAFFPIIINNDTKAKVYEMEDGKRGELLAAHDPTLLGKLKESKSFGGLVPEGKIPLIMTTYSQHQNTGYQLNGKTNKGQIEKNDMLLSLAKNSLVLLDESHNAAGEDSNIGRFVDQLKTNAMFVMSSSATSAKRLTQAPAYKGIFGPSVDFEALGQVSMDDSEYLLETLFRGASELGTFFSVNRDLSKSEFEYEQDPKYEARDLEIGDKFAMALQALGRFSGEVSGTLSAVTERYRDANEAFRYTSIPEGQPTSVSGTNFGSLNHQLCKLFTLLINLDATVDKAIADYRDGKRSVIALDSTAETIVKTYMAEIQTAAQVKEMHEKGSDQKTLEKLDMSYQQALNVLDGVKIEGSSLILPYEMDARDALTRTLDRMQWVTERRSGMPSEVRNVFEIAAEQAKSEVENSRSFKLMEPTEKEMAISEAIKMAHDKLNRFIDSIRDAIHEIGPALPISPIDYLRDRLSEAGMNVGEMSGRQLGIKVGNGQTVISKLPRLDKNRLKARFNHKSPQDKDRVDCLILTRTGASGLSVHDSITNKYHAQRSMIFAQLPDDVNTFLQFGGRVDRAGQITDPKVVLIGSGLLFPKKAIASMVRKLQQSGAATMGNRDGSRKLPESPDYFNVIGDKAAYDLLVDNPDILQLFAEGGMRAAQDIQTRLAGTEVRGDPRFDSMDDLAKKLVAYTSIMTQDQGVRVANELESRYTALFDELARIGLNPLVTKKIDGNAEIVRSEKVHAAISVLPDGRDDPFSGDVHQAVIRIEEPVRSDPIEEVEIEVASGGYFCRRSELMEHLDVKKGETLHKVADALLTRKQALLARFVSKEDVDQAIKEFGRAETDAENKFNAVQVAMARDNSRVKDVNQRLDYLSSTLRNMGVGYTVELPSEYSEERVRGVIRDILPPDTLSTIATLSAWRIKIAIPNEGHINHPLSHLHELNAEFRPEYWKVNGLYEALRDQTSVSRSRERNALLGNQITGMINYTNLARHASTARGSIGGHEQAMMLLPYNLDAKNLPANTRPKLSGMKAVLDFVEDQMRKGGSKPLKVHTAPLPNQDKHGAYLPQTTIKINDGKVALHVPKSVMDSDSEIYRDKELRELAQRDFAGLDDYMLTTFRYDDLPALVKRLMGHHRKSFYAPIEFRADVAILNENSKILVEEAYRSSSFESRLGIPADLASKDLVAATTMLLAADSVMTDNAKEKVLHAGKTESNSKRAMPSVEEVMADNVEEYDLFADYDEELNQQAVGKIR